MFSTALPPSVCAAACRAVELIELEPWHRQHVLQLAKRFRQALGQLGLETPPGGAGPIVPVILGDPEETLRIAQELEEAGFLVAAIRPPTVPRGTSRLRITLTAAHTDDDLKALIGQLAKFIKPAKAEMVPVTKGSTS
jgi:8-amino-7-oxononanoate synthase